MRRERAAVYVPPDGQLRRLRAAVQGADPRWSQQGMEAYLGLAAGRLSPLEHGKSGLSIRTLAGLLQVYRAVLDPTYSLHLVLADLPPPPLVRVPPPAWQEGKDGEIQRWQLGRYLRTADAVAHMAAESDVSIWTLRSMLRGTSQGSLATLRAIYAYGRDRWSVSLDHLLVVAPMAVQWPARSSGPPGGEIRRVPPRRADSS